MEREKTEIIDFSGEKFSNFAMPCWFIMVIVLSIAILNMFFMFKFPRSQIATLLSIALVIIFILYYYYVATKSPGKLRKFSISSEGIEVLLPHKPKFLIYWSGFEKIEVRLMKIGLKPFDIYFFHFFNHNTEKKVSVSLDDFHRDKIIEFLKVLREYAFVMRKEFSAVKQTNISGVYLVEDLEFI